MSLTNITSRPDAIGAAICAALGVMIYAQTSAAQESDRAKLAPHRAVYDFVMPPMPEAAGMTATGEMTSSLKLDCGDYLYHEKFSLSLNSDELGPLQISGDWSAKETYDAKRFDFDVSMTYGADEADRMVGRASRGSDGVVARMIAPEVDRMELPDGVVFPFEAIRRIIEAAKMGRKRLDYPYFEPDFEAPLMEAVVEILGEAPPPPADSDLAELGRGWNIRLNLYPPYIDSGPLETVEAILFEAGVMAAVRITYDGFVLEGRLASLEMLEETCEAQR